VCINIVVLWEPRNPIPREIQSRHDDEKSPSVDSQHGAGFTFAQNLRNRLLIRAVLLSRFRSNSAPSTNQKTVPIAGLPHKRLSTKQFEQPPGKPVRDQTGLSARIQRHKARLAVWRKKYREAAKINPPPRIAKTISGTFSRNQIRKKYFEENQQHFLSYAVNRLERQRPEYSSKTTFTFIQALFLFVALAICASSFVSNGPSFLSTANLAISFFYLGTVLLRGMLLAGFRGRQKSPKPEEIAAVDFDKLPKYSILVALYQEENQVRQLVENLCTLNWPTERLEIKLLCEADDPATIKAVRSLNLPSHIDVIEVPVGHPRTKPKALNYALPLCTGEFLALYDAEDQPHPDQLIEAFLKFRQSDANLACLQAPLYIHNNQQSWLTSMFAAEYCTLFEGILPILERWGAPIPLGGTSNHFRLDILQKVGGWDPYNVTEDADLGIRLAREGYRSGTITRPTWEEAPPTYKDWLPQRTRWMKGWMQTILVHSRSPRLLIQQIGWRSFVMFHLLITSIVVSAIIHPIFLVTATIQLMNIHNLSGNLESVLQVVSIFVLVGGYTTYGLLASIVLESCNFNHLKKILWTLPFYWLLISFAGWRAIWQLLTRPHFWEKTKHGLANRPMDITLKRGFGLAVRPAAKL